MSETFCKKSNYSNEDEKIFLQSEIKYHSVWHNNENYWREIIIHSIREEVNGNNAVDNIEGLLDTKDLSEIVETKLNWFIHDMVSYEIDLQTIES